MQIIADGKLYEGTAVEILDQIRQGHIDADTLETPEAYFAWLQHSYLRLTGRRARIIRGSFEDKAKDIFSQLAEIGVVDIIGE